MLKGQKSVRGGIEDFLCPFTDVFITQGPNESYSHKGIMAWDVRGAEPGVRYPYYAPATVKCIRTYPESGQSMWQTVNNVRCSNGYIGKVTFMVVHDDTMDCYAGMVLPQGDGQLGNMGKKGNATGVHCHIEFSQSADTTWKKNSYGNYMFNNEVDPENVCFMDNTNIISGSGNWKYLKDVPVDEPKKEEPKPVVDEDKVKIEELEKKLTEKDSTIKTLEEQLTTNTELISSLQSQLEEQPKLIFTCTQTNDYQIKLYENERLYIRDQ